MDLQAAGRVAYQHPEEATWLGQAAASIAAQEDLKVASCAEDTDRLPLAAEAYHGGEVGEGFEAGLVAAHYQDVEVVASSSAAVREWEASEGPSGYLHSGTAT